MGTPPCSSPAASTYWLAPARARSLQSPCPRKFARSSLPFTNPPTLRFDSLSAVFPGAHKESRRMFMTPKGPVSRRIALGTFLALVGAAAVSLGELPPVISRDILFGNPDKTSPKLSPDGIRLAWIAPDAKNVL